MTTGKEERTCEIVVDDLDIDWLVSGSLKSRWPPQSLQCLMPPRAAVVVPPSDIVLKPLEISCCILY